MKHVACNLCGADRARLILRGVDRRRLLPGPHRVVQCRACGLRYLDPQPGPEDLAPYYSHDYYAFQCHDRAGLRGRVWEALESRYVGDAAAGAPGAASGLYRTMLRSFPPARPPGRLLDIGCGAGDALLLLRRAGWGVVGWEPSEEACAEGRARGLDIHPGLAEDLDLPAASFDWVRLSHCLEHCRDPRRVMERVRDVLRPGGRVIVACPDSGGLPAQVLRENWLEWEIPRHLFHFTASALCRLMSRCGLTPSRVRRYWIPHRSFSGIGLRLGLFRRFPVGLPPIGGPVVDALRLYDELVVWARR